MDLRLLASRADRADEAGNHIAAISTWRRMLLRSQDADWSIFFKLSRALAKIGRIEEARSVALRGIAGHPEQGLLSAQLAELFFQKGELVESMRLFDQAFAAFSQKKVPPPSEILQSFSLVLEHCHQQLGVLLGTSRMDEAEAIVRSIPKNIPSDISPKWLDGAMANFFEPTTVSNGTVSKDTAVRGSVFFCPVCRTKDVFAEEQRVCRVFLNTAKAADISVWQLPAVEGLRLGVAQSLTSSFVMALRARCKEEGVAISVEEKALENNEYEFDQEQFVSPEKSVTLFLSPEPHCRDGASYLKRRKVVVELIEERRDTIVIPEAGLGPRIYSKEELPPYAIGDSSPEILDVVPFPVDLVYTWVDSSDPIWTENYAKVAHETEEYKSLKTSVAAARWIARDELLFSLRSVGMYAPFFRKIFIVTNGQKPKWLVENDRVKVISHAEIFPDPSVLPNFNSNVIETVLHNIPGLTEHFVYLNDDFFFLSKCTPHDFFSIGGVEKLFFARRRFTDARPVEFFDRPTVACHKNSHFLLKAKYGLDCYQKLRHAPYVMRKSVWKRIEEDFGPEFERHRKNRFRARSDLTGPFFQAHYALINGYGTRDDIPYAYIDLGVDDVAARLKGVDAKNCKVLCLNDTASSGDEVERDKELRAIFEARFPIRGHWEAADQGREVG